MNTYEYVVVKKRCLILNPRNGMMISSVSFFRLKTTKRCAMVHFSLGVGDVVPCFVAD
jgi:hypothetical protein